KDIPYASHVLTLPFKKKITAFQNFPAAYRLRKTIQQEQYTAIIVHTSLAAFFTRLAVLTLRKRPTVIHMVHGYLFDDQTKPLRRTILLTADRMMAPVTDLLLTMNGYDHCIAQKYHLGKRIQQIPGIGVDYARLDRQAKTVSSNTLRGSLGISPDAYILIYPAEFTARKSQHVLLRAMTLLPEQVVLILPGIGVCLEQCKRMASQLNLSHRVIFPGYVTNIGAWYAMADIAISSSRSEGLPFSIIEPMHCKIPVVASAVKGHMDLIRHKETGLLYPYGDWTQCADRVRQLMEDPKLAASLARNAQESVRQYDLSNVHPLVMGQYNHAIDARNPSKL
ncbi:MAG: glycosyltransferase, partial [Lachnospiraceae bacterium]|nr:glycosyltransferase [Lachnospiraceae bacterium]